MESNNKNTNYGQGEQQLRKRKFNELVNDDHDQRAAAEGEQKQQHPREKNLSKKKCAGQQGNDALLENVHLESLTREDLIQLVQKQLANQNEAQKQLEAVKKEAEESAKQQAKETASKMEEHNKALLASQQKVEQLTTENIEHQQKHLDSDKQAEEFSQRIIQLESEKAAVHADLNKKLAEIVEMRKEMELKSEELAEKAKQIDALLVQLNESTRQHQIELPMPTEQQMKMRIHFLQHSLRLIRRHFIGQLPLENWVDLFGFVPRRQLVQLLPQIDDRHFAEVLQYFLQKVGKITLEYLAIVPPTGNDINGGPMVGKGGERLDLADTQMPGNIKNFDFIRLKYLDISVVNFLRHFQQNSLLQNVNLVLYDISNEILLQFLTHVLPLIDSIESIRMDGIPKLNKNSDSPPAENNNEFNQSLLNSMMAQTRIFKYGSGLKPDELDWCCNWLYNTPRNDGRPRLLILAIYSPTGISFIVDRIKQDFVSAIHPISFFVTINVPNNFHWPHQDISLENGRTNEKMVVRKAQTTAGIVKRMLISRHQYDASKQWIEQNKKEILDFDFEEQNRNISLGYGTQIAI